ncbi:Asp-tRNA(Asn)/Glu-tRNA(Gln) amidotransferase subunit GatB [Bulleidia extructa]|uniref:Asp-tRNA(Asn)/Glu-tRNA(Gln) amidotransferase subunit GatB n=1 Tax=Bulleidia extructa TaxID=118748 RepID=UPI002353FA17|nr:Asp-tRNA(Asn)/Glu-tRNA(Gln) amidotransferase subunit GatB [Bulleidia extructa]
MEYDVTIGIEIHVQLKTNTKMFSGAPTSFGRKANTCVNEIDLGHPGTLPEVNKEAVRKAIQACTALHLTIDPLVKFDRKNYYYSDLPKGYQITQQFHPIGRDGYVEIESDGQIKKIRIERIHMEEDTAKQFHLTNFSLIDFNRAGTPLIEIVSRPDMKNGQEAEAYVEALRQTLYYLGVSDVKMEEGSMRCDVNISLAPKGSRTLGVKNEIKNINSISHIGKAVEYEIQRQSALLEAGEEVHQETRRFDDKTNTTISMRVKEGTVDYKYFPEPNIFPIRLDPKWIEEIQSSLPELPETRKNRYKHDYDLNAHDIHVLIANKEMSDYFETVLPYSDNPKGICNWLLGEISAWLNKHEMSLQEVHLSQMLLAKLVKMVDDGTISNAQAKKLVEDLMAGKDPEMVAKEKGLVQVSDMKAIQAMVDAVLEENPQAIEDFNNGKDKAIGFLVGQVMKQSRGQANPQIVNGLVKEALEKRRN